MRFGFARPIFTGDGGHVREVRGFDLTSAKRHDLFAAETKKRPIASFHFPGRALLPVVLSRCRYQNFDETPVA